MLLRLAYLALTGVVTFLRLLPMSSTDKDIEILALRHQLTVLQHRVHKPRFTPPDRAFLAALPHSIPRPTLRQHHLIVSPDIILRWHRALLRRHAKASRPQRPGRPPTIRSIQALVLRLVRENPNWGYRRVHGELHTRGIKVAPSTVWKILKTNGIEPAPHRDHLTWTTFLRSQAQAILAADFFDTTTLTGTRLYVLVVIEHASRRIRILGATAHPAAGWITHLARNLIMDLQDAGATMKYLIRDRDSKYTTGFDAALADEGIAIRKTGIRVSRMNAIMERWVCSCRAELLDSTLIVNQTHLLHVLREYESFYNEHPHRALHAAAPLRPLPEPTTQPDTLNHLDIRRRDRLGGILHEYHHAA